MEPSRPGRRARRSSRSTRPRSRRRRARCRAACRRRALSNRVSSSARSASAPEIARSTRPRSNGSRPAPTALARGLGRGDRAVHVLGAALGDPVHGFAGGRVHRVAALAAGGLDPLAADATAARSGAGRRAPRGRVREDSAPALDARLSGETSSRQLRLRLEAEDLAGLRARDQRLVRAQLAAQRHARVEPLDQLRGRCVRADVVGDCVDGLVVDVRMLAREAVEAGDVPQVDVDPERAEVELGVADRLDRLLAELGAPAVTGPDADGLEQALARISPAGLLGGDLAHPVAVLRAQRVVLVDREVVRLEVVRAVGEPEDRLRGGVDEPLHARGDRGLEAVDGALGVDAEHHVRRGEALLGDRREVDDGVAAGERGGEGVAVLDVGQAERGALDDGLDQVDRDDLVPCLDHLGDDEPADPACCSGDGDYQRRSPC